MLDKPVSALPGPAPGWAQAHGWAVRSRMDKGWRAGSHLSLCAMLREEKKPTAMILNWQNHCLTPWLFYFFPVPHTLFSSILTLTGCFLMKWKQLMGIRHSLHTKYHPQLLTCICPLDPHDKLLRKHQPRLRTEMKSPSPLGHALQKDCCWDWTQAMWI